MKAFIFHHVSQPLRCCHERFTVIGIDFLWTALSGDQALKGADELVSLQGFGFLGKVLVSGYRRTGQYRLSLLCFCLCGT